MEKLKIADYVALWGFGGAKGLKGLKELKVHPSSVFLATKGKNFRVPITNPAFSFIYIYIKESAWFKAKFWRTHYLKVVFLHSWLLWENRNSFYNA